MKDMKSTIIWKKLIIDSKKIITSEEILEIANSLNKRAERSLIYLQEEGYITRILRGIFYIKNPNERERGYFESSIYEMIAMALAVKGVKKWYFGLETALKLNNMTHEYFDVNYVFTDSYMTSKIIKILDTNFLFFKRKKSHFNFGIIKKTKLYISDPERTILDLSYNIYLKKKDANYFLAPLKEYADKLDQEKLKKYLINYSLRFQHKVEEKQ